MYQIPGIKFNSLAQPENSFALPQNSLDHVPQNSLALPNHKIYLPCPTTHLPCHKIHLPYHKIEFHKTETSKLVYLVLVYFINSFLSISVCSSYFACFALIVVIITVRVLSFPAKCLKLVYISIHQKYCISTLTL